MTTSASPPRPQALGDATQKLVAEARTCDPEEGLAYQHDLIQRLADALEAAQRPPISPEVRKEMFRLLYDASGSQLMRPNERHSMVTEQRDALLARFSVPSRPPVSPEQREALDELIADVLIAERDEWPRDPGDAPSEVLAGAVADAILARFTIPVLDAEKVARCLARADGTDYDVETDGLRMSYDTLAAALVAAIQNGELTREETNE